MEKVCRVRFWIYWKPWFGCSIDRTKKGWSFWSRRLSGPPRFPGDEVQKDDDHHHDGASLGEVVGILIHEVLERASEDTEPGRPFEIGFCDYNEDWNWTAPCAPPDQETEIVRSAADAVAYIVGKILKKWPTKD